MKKVRMAENGWNSRNLEEVALAYTLDSEWRNRSEFVNGREAIIGFLARKSRRELEYRLIKELWAFADNRIAKDPFFLPVGAEASRRDLPNAEVRHLDAGHFAVETHASEIASAIVAFLT